MECSAGEVRSFVLMMYHCSHANSRWIMTILIEHKTEHFMLHLVWTCRIWNWISSTPLPMTHPSHPQPQHQSSVLNPCTLMNYEQWLHLLYSKKISTTNCHSCTFICSTNFMSLWYNGPLQLLFFLIFTTHTFHRPMKERKSVGYRRCQANIHTSL